MTQHKIKQAGVQLRPSGKAMIMIHGRGANADDILSLASNLPVKEYTLLAPQAATGAWYPYSFMAPVQQNQPHLDEALHTLAGLEAGLLAKGIKSQDLYWVGFSQGACLTLEYVTRNAKSYGGVLAFTGGLIGATLDTANYNGHFGNTPVFIGSSDPDAHVPVERVQESARIISAMGGDVCEMIYPGMGHTITMDEIRDATAHVWHIH